MQFDAEIVARIAMGVMFVGAAAIGIPHRVRADRIGGHVSARSDPTWFWICMSLTGPPLVLVCLAFLVHPRWVDFGRIDVPAWVRLTGVPVSLMGLGLFVWMFHHLGLNVTSTSVPRANATLVTTGPYRWMRHPMYSAALTLGIAASLLTANWIAAVCSAVMFVLLAARSNVEERRLVEKFGDAYREYQRRTGRFFPRLRNERR